MASSSSRKSSSSASNGPKPSYRRAAAAPGAKSRVAQGSVVRRRPAVGGVGNAVASPSKRVMGARPAAKRPVATPAARPTKRPAVASRPRMGAGVPAGPRSARPQASAGRPAVARPAAASARPLSGGRGAAKPAKPAKAGAPRSAARKGLRVVASPAPKSAAPAGAIASRPAKAPKALKASKAPMFKAARKPVAPAPASRGPNPLAAPAAKLFASIAAALKRLPVPHLGRGPLLIGIGALVAVALVAIVVVNSPLLGVTELEVRGSEHMSQEAAQKLIEVPEGSTLLNVDTDAIAASLAANPWVSGVDIERSFPHKLIVTPRERAVSAIAYITADDIAWAIGEDGMWIAPLSLSVTLDAEGTEIDPPADGALPEGARQLAGLEAAQHIARRGGALLLIDVPSDVDPASGKEINSEVVRAGLEYAKEFSPEFMLQVKDLSIASTEAISANLTSGIEVSLGKPERIVEKERVVTKLLEQEGGVTYINVREPGAYTFRSAPQ